MLYQPSRLSEISIYLGFGLFLLIGPVHALAVKGFAPLLALSGIACIIGGFFSGNKLQLSSAKNFGFISLFTIYLFLAVFWSSNDKALSRFLVFLSIVIFSMAIIHSSKKLPAQQRQLWHYLLVASVTIGCILTMILGPYNVYWPQMQADLNYPYEILRQVNRSLIVLPIMLMILAVAIGKSYRYLVLIGLVASLIITYLSNSQSALLAVLLALAGLAIGYFAASISRFLIWACLAIGLLAAPWLHIASFENKWVANYGPDVIVKKGSAEIREWIFYVFAKETMTKPAFGHGFRSSRNFQPVGMESYFIEGEARGKSTKAFLHGQKQNQTIAQHPHNIFLQIIYELGYVGAILLLAAAWQFLKRVEEAFLIDQRPWIWAAVGAGLGGIMFSHSVWQSWSMAMWACCIVLLFTLRQRHRAQFTA